MPEVFLSYARKDGETLAAHLRSRLAKEASDIQFKYDRLFLEGGRDWWQQVAKAIENVHFLILLLTPAALASGNVEKEWRHARRHGICVYPVKDPKNPPDFRKMPRRVYTTFAIELAAVKAMARYLAVLIFRLLTKGEAWVDRGAAQFERRREERELASLNSRASVKGYRLIPIAEAH